VNIRSPEIPDTQQSGSARSVALALALAAVGLLSYAACTAEKTETRNHEARSTAVAPKLVDGVFAIDDHLQAVYFDLNKSKLSDSALETVKANAEWIKSQPPYLIHIVGFADSRGSLKKNERLAERRANALRDAYVALGIPKERLSIFPRGAEEPACQPVTEDCLAKSRRTETLLENKSLVSR
jgi:outer membrane protein OmpA-like peptidoglycan-associated protein